MDDEPPSMSVLNYDCLCQVIKHIPLQEAMKYRTVSKDWNSAICDHLKEKQTLKVFQDVSAINEMHAYFYPEQEVYPFLRFSDRIEDDDVLVLGGCDYRKVRSFVSFVETRMPNIRKLLLLFNDGRLFESLDIILDSVPKMETFFLSNTDSSLVLQDHYKNALDVLNRWMQRRANPLKELFFLPFINGAFQFDVQRPERYNGLVDSFRGLRLLNTSNPELFNAIDPLPNIRELWLSSLFSSRVKLENVPNLETLHLDSSNVTLLENSPNLKCLQTLGNIWITCKFLTTLNTLPKLEKFSCRSLSINQKFSDNFSTDLINRTITHLQLTGRMEDKEKDDWNSLQVFQRDLPAILKVFAALERLIIVHRLNEEQKKSIQDLVPERIAVEFVDYDRKRFMGRFKD